MKILIACEFSGIVREAFRAKGHDVWSCDLLPTETPGNHFLGEVEEVLGYGWDLMIAHPPCTYLAFCGMRWNVGNLERQQKTRKAIEFFLTLWNAPIPKIVIENPVGVIPRHTGIKWTQIIQPWQHGHPETKATCLWLKGGLPILVPSNPVPGRKNRIHMMPPSKDRWKIKSRTYTGIAQAMAEQWG